MHHQGIFRIGGPGTLDKVDNKQERYPLDVEEGTPKVLLKQTEHADEGPECKACSTGMEVSSAWRASHPPVSLSEAC